MTISPADLHAVTAPVTRARGLPNPCYTDSAVFAQEVGAVFAPGWAGIGFEADAPQPGSVTPIDFLGRPLLLARDLEGTLRVFENVCRHRGMTLVAEAGTRVRTLRCPYHAWCYDLDGRLRTTPHVGGPGNNRHDCIDRAQLGLNEVRAHLWMGIVWVNLDGSAAPFNTHAAPLRGRWAEVDRPVTAAPDTMFELEVACNWKLAVENYCESYHLPWVHPGLNSYSRLEDHYNIEVPGLFAGQGTRAYRPMLAADGRRFPPISGLSDWWQDGAEYVALFPNVLLGVHKDHMHAIVLMPEGPERTVERVALLFPDAQVLQADWAEMRSAARQMWKEIFIEDIGVVEGMQRGRHAAGFDGGRFSPVMDSPTHLFHAWVADKMAASSL
ncbi:MAG: aromatic ring-hydroxylating dioxygenase subunit alpha [Pikeienuella sp.]